MMEPASCDASRLAGLYKCGGAIMSNSDSLNEKDSFDIPPMTWMNGKLIRETTGWYWMDGERAPEIRDVNPADSYQFRIYREKAPGLSSRNRYGTAEWVMIPRSYLFYENELRYFKENWFRWADCQPLEVSPRDRQFYCFIPAHVYRSWAWNSIPSCTFRDEDYFAIRLKSDSLPGPQIDWSLYNKYRQLMKLCPYFFPIQCA